ncbi:MAG: hypothetical protein AABZ35_06355 [Gemmatimonadota bacterium]
MQTPPIPPMPPMPPEFHGIMTGHDIVTIVVFSLMGAAVMVWLVARGPIGHAIGEVIKRWLGGSRQDVGQLDDLNHRLDAMQHQLGDLAERQDFAERLLAQVRRDKALPGGSDVAG